MSTEQLMPVPNLLEQELLFEEVEVDIEAYSSCRKKFGLGYVITLKVGEEGGSIFPVFRLPLRF